MNNDGRSKYRRTKTQKADRLVAPDVSALESKIHFLCAPFDRAEKQMDAAWGVNQLPGLVSPDMAGKYGMSVGTLNEAIEAQDAELVEKWVGVCIRGLRAMEAQAIELGHKKITGQFVEIQIDAYDHLPSVSIGILLDPDHREAAQSRRPDLTFITPREAALAYQIKLATPMVSAVKEHFPGATITAIRPNPPVDYANGGDDIPPL